MNQKTLFQIMYPNQAESYQTITYANKEIRRLKDRKSPKIAALNKGAIEKKSRNSSSLKPNFD